MKKMVLNKKSAIVLPLLIVLLLSVLLLDVEATVSGSLANSNIGLSSTDSNGTWAASGNTIACNSVTGKKSSSLTITNKYSTPAILTFDIRGNLKGAKSSILKAYPSKVTVGTVYSAISEGNLFSAGSEVQYSKSGITLELDAGTSVVITLQCGQTASATISNISLVQKITVSATFNPIADNAQYTVTYYADSATTTVSSATVSNSSVTLTGDKARGFTIVRSGFVCLGANYTYGIDDNEVENGYLFATNDVLKPENEYKVTPDFLATPSGTVAPFKVNGASYWTWETAFHATGDSGTVVLATDYALPLTYADNGLSGAGSYVTGKENALVYKIPAGVTLLLPYSDSDLTIKGGSQSTNDYKHANVTFIESGGSTTSNMSTGKSVLHELEIPQGIRLEVADGTDSKYGRIVIGGTIIGKEGSGHFDGANYGAHSNIILNGELGLGNHAVLSVAGYIYGTGCLKTRGAKAQIYQPMVIRDWRGAGAAMLFVDTSVTDPAWLANNAFHSGEKLISPFTQWGTFNIQTDLSIDSGNYMFLYASLREDGNAHTSHPVMIGDTTKPGFIILDAGSCLKSEYKSISWSSNYKYAFPGKTCVTIFGGASFGSLSLTVQVGFGSMDVNTSDFTTFISYCYDVSLADGDYYIDNPIAFLPGATLKVESTATLSIGTVASSAVRCMFIDGLVHRVKQANGASNEGVDKYTHTVPYIADGIDDRSYPTTSELQESTCGGSPLSGDANLIVNGKLTLGANAAFGGVVQTTANGIVDASAFKENEVSKCTVQVGLTGAKYYTLIISNYSRYCAGMSLYERTAQLVDRNGNRFDILGGNVYYSYYAESTQETYSFKYYAEANKPYNVVLVGDVTAASGETATTADACALNETIYGAWYIPTLPVHSTSAREDGMKIDAEYRLQDYVWLNAVCYLGDLNSAIANATSGIITTQIIDSTGKAWKNTFDLSTSKMTSEENGVQVLIVNGAVYLVKKISADEIPDKVTIVIMFNDGTMEYISAPVSVHLSECKNGDAKTDALVDSMLDYGDAAKLYFNSADAPDAKLELSLGSSYLAFKKIVNANGSHNGVTLVTKGANVLFEERLSLMFGFELSKTLAASDILQIGVLIGEPGKYTAQSPLTVAGYDKALIFYGVANEDALSGNAPTLPTNDIFKVDSKYAMGTVDELQKYLDNSARMIVYMDLKSVEYTSAFEFRPFVITKDGTVLYGAQYAYGLADYINNMCTKTDDALQNAIGKDKNVDAFRNLLICTWDYALKADAKFNQVQGDNQ